MSRLFGLQSHLEIFLFENVRGACRRSGVLVFSSPLYSEALIDRTVTILAPVAFSLESDFAGGGGEQRMVRTKADITARMEIVFLVGVQESCRQ